MSACDDDTELELHDQMVEMRRAIRKALATLKTPILQSAYWGHFPSARHGLLNATQLPLTRDELIDDLVEPEVARILLKRIAQG